MFVQKQELGIELLIHGRSPEKLEAASNLLLSLNPHTNVSVYKADLSSVSATKDFAQAVLNSHSYLDVLINNAGILKTLDTRTEDDFDVRFAVNTSALFVLTHCLLPIIQNNGRIVNLSSAAQSPIDESLLCGRSQTSNAMQA
ncbi:MAG: SDR family NAD(P)-dependent oxidoreductase [Oleiphilaceae bacterium]|nr:SDR family NAD(P)-dependent oxidoreductase [Oleiphilaceae bacterium]